MTPSAFGSTEGRFVWVEKKNTRYDISKQSHCPNCAELCKHDEKKSTYKCARCRIEFTARVVGRMAGAQKEVSE
jgi:ribosomal protein L37AE/L43A